MKSEEIRSIMEAVYSAELSHCRKSETCVILYILFVHLLLKTVLGILKCAYDPLKSGSGKPPCSFTI